MKDKANITKNCNIDLQKGRLKLSFPKERNLMILLTTLSVTPGINDIPTLLLSVLSFVNVKKNETSSQGFSKKVLYIAYYGK